VSKDSDSNLVSNKILSQKWAKTYPTYDVTHKKPETQNQNNFL